MQVARLLFELSSREATGTMTVAVGEPVVENLRVELNRGWLRAVAISPRQARGEDALRLLLKRAPARARFLPDDMALGTGRVAPFHPAVVVRNHVESTLGPDAGPSLREQAGRGKVRLVYAPHVSCLGRDERPLVTLLAQERLLDELDRAGVAPPGRVERLLAFLHAVGSVALDGDAPTAYQLLALPEGAPHEEVRRAYKRIARTLHPDLHPGASESEKRRLETEFATLTAAYRKLLPGG